jgi:hypothetical protein
VTPTVAAIDVWLAQRSADIDPTKIPLAASFYVSRPPDRDPALAPGQQVLDAAAESTTFARKNSLRTALRK